MGEEPTGQPAPTTGKRKKSFNWKLGLKIGCGGVLLVIVIAAGVGYALLKDALVAFDDIRKSEQRLVEKYGGIESFRPEADGCIPAGRMEVFLKVRESLLPLQGELEASLTRMLAKVSRAQNEDKTILGVLHLVQDGSKVLPEAARYFSARNLKLLELGMGLGEYYYVYAMAYYAALGISPEDGPDFSFLGAGNKNSSLYYAMQEMLKSREEKKRDSEEGIYLEMERGRGERRWREAILAMMQNQLQRAAAAGPTVEAGPGTWQSLLAADIEKLKADRQRLPWQDGLPGVLQQSLQPFLERLKASYIRLMNPLEFGLHKLME